MLVPAARAAPVRRERVEERVRRRVVALSGATQRARCRREQHERAQRRWPASARADAARRPPSARTRARSALRSGSAPCRRPARPTGAAPPSVDARDRRSPAAPPRPRAAPRRRPRSERSRHRARQLRRELVARPAPHAPPRGEQQMPDAVRAHQVRRDRLAQLAGAAGDQHRAVRGELERSRCLRRRSRARTAAPPGAWPVAQHELRLRRASTARAPAARGRSLRGRSRSISRSTRSGCSVRAARRQTPQRRVHQVFDIALRDRRSPLRASRTTSSLPCSRGSLSQRCTSAERAHRLRRAPHPRALGPARRRWRPPPGAVARDRHSRRRAPRAARRARHASAARALRPSAPSPPARRVAPGVERRGFGQRDRLELHPIEVLLIGTRLHRLQLLRARGAQVQRADPRHRFARAVRHRDRRGDRLPLGLRGSARRARAARWLRSRTAPRPTTRTAASPCHRRLRRRRAQRPRAYAAPRRAAPDAARTPSRSRAAPRVAPRAHTAHPRSVAPRPGPETPGRTAGRARAGARTSRSASSASLPCGGQLASASNSRAAPVPPCDSALSTPVACRTQAPGSTRL